MRANPRKGSGAAPGAEQRWEARAREGLAAFQAGRIEEAYAAGRSAAAIARAFTADDPRRAASRTHLALCHAAGGNAQAARRAFRRALRAWEAADAWVARMAWPTERGAQASICGCKRSIPAGTTPLPARATPGCWAPAGQRPSQAVPISLATQRQRWKKRSRSGRPASAGGTQTGRRYCAPWRHNGSRPAPTRGRRMPGNGRKRSSVIRSASVRSVWRPSQTARLRAISGVSRRRSI